MVIRTMSSLRNASTTQTFDHASPAYRSTYTLALTGRDWSPPPSRPAPIFATALSHSATLPTESDFDRVTINVNSEGACEPRYDEDGREVDERGFPATLVPSGALDPHVYPRSDLAPAIGTEFDPSVQLADILDAPNSADILRDLAILISHRGVVFFKHQDILTPQQLATVTKLLGELSGSPKASGLHIHPLTSDFSESGEFIGKISNEREANGAQISFADERSNFASAGWHTDISFEPVPSNFAALRMHTLPPTGGDTLWASSYAAYEKLSPAMAQMLEGCTATHHADMFKEQASRYGFPLRTEARGHPLNVGDHLSASHPVIRTNPVTGLKGLFVNKSFTKRINELSRDESNIVLEYLYRLISDNHDIQVRYRWGLSDVAIWSNTSTQHCATFDYDGPRGGDRAVSLGEVPYYDPASRSRKEALEAAYAV
ncbi:uncharacterized protein L969DRAFT_96654 [Mixia osmundae IAM 14324]|uniref:TauD/TfdA-like domain-containing protein n=1 Tax=Mixia osmundae (strain CBS 9802 / IAM 14324 / JCM 22182 / KY 12970) TaxID=764103 RepID=G7DU18_MIXOS|nr:uncharacterized protein L969DRAFT_96654 [Mixia osmundae IAM 14324]KEI37080.1 hypothetical protein L969DRAFT_96654 [Mixia osmundae IAM 14324]GAA94078.1 hypothetical protein E5Q_00725 [Mixia osmundae IAM 14324]